MTPVDMLHLAALSGGVTLIASLIVRKPKTVEQLVEKLDVRLAAELSAVVVYPSSCSALLSRLSLWQIDRQARLLLRITIELAKLNPEQFANLPHEQRHRVWMLRCMSLLNLFECLRDRMTGTRDSELAAVEFAHSFLAIFDATESQIVCFDVLKAGERPCGC